MLSLALDTSTEDTILLLFEKQRRLSSKNLSHQNNLSASLVPSIENLLLENNKTPKDLKRIFVGIGPGSYTGTRVGVCVAEGLALALEIPVHPFCSLLAFIPQTVLPGKLTCLWHAKHGSHFLLDAVLQEDGQFTNIKKTIAPEQQLLELLPTEGPMVLFCDKTKNELIQASFPSSITIIKPESNPERLLSHLETNNSVISEKLKIIYLHTLI